MNHVLHPATSREGLQKQVREFIAQELRSLLHVDDADWVRRRLRASGVNTVGKDKLLLAYWYRDTEKQVTALWPKAAAAPAAAPVRRVSAKPKPQPLLQPVNAQLGLFEREKPQLAFYP